MFLNRFAIKLIKKYQSIKSKPPRCRHIPSCSQYSLECYQKFNFLKASALTTYRIIRCNPLSKNIFDPVPLSKKEKLIRKQYEQVVSLDDDKIINLYIKDCNTTIDDAIIYIQDDMFKNNHDMMLFYAKLDRLVFLAKKKQIPFKKKLVINKINEYLSNNTYMDKK